MNTKLTLKLDKEVIDLAKKYASQKKLSLSKLVENYFKQLSVTKKQTDLELSPRIKELSGIIQLDENFDFEKEYTEYLMDKHK